MVEDLVLCSQVPKESHNAVHIWWEWHTDVSEVIVRLFFPL
jgi:hypothetical protein